MVHPGPVALTEIGADTPAPGYALAVHVTDLVAQRRRAGSRALAAPQRDDTHAITLITRGRGRHVVDFEAYPCAPGTLLWVRPGQVQQFQTPSRLGGVQVRFTATVPASGAAGSLYRLVNAATGAQVRRLATAEQADVGDLVERLATEFALKEEDPARARKVLGYRLILLLHRIGQIERADHTARSARADRSANDELHSRFVEELELGFTRTRRVQDYAGLLGCPARTLTTACQEAAGRSAKDLIDERIVLEARRMLATTDDPLVDIAHRLGFSEATTLSRYFARHGSEAPTALRKRYRPG